MIHLHCPQLIFVHQHHTFYDFIINKARGKSGPLFNFDVHDDVRLLADATKEKDESHAGKVVERSWYQRNKHIFPASRWEVSLRRSIWCPYADCLPNCCAFMLRFWIRCLTRRKTMESIPSLKSSKYLPYIVSCLLYLGFDNLKNIPLGVNMSDLCTDGRTVCFSLLSRYQRRIYILASSSCPAQAHASPSFQHGWRSRTPRPVSRVHRRATRCLPKSATHSRPDSVPFCEKSTK